MASERPTSNDDSSHRSNIAMPKQSTSSTAAESNHSDDERTFSSSVSERLKMKMGTAREEATELLNSAKTTLASTTSNVTSTVSETASSMQHKVSETASAASSKLADTANAAKQRLAEVTGTAAESALDLKVKAQQQLYSNTTASASPGRTSEHQTRDSDSKKRVSNSQQHKPQADDATGSTSQTAHGETTEVVEPTGSSKTNATPTITSSHKQNVKNLENSRTHESGPPKSKQDVQHSAILKSAL